MDVLAGLRVVPVGEPGHEAGALTIRIERNPADKELIVRGRHDRIARGIEGAQLRRLVPVLGAQSRRQRVMSGVESRVPVLAAVVAERETNERLRRRDPLCALAFSLPLRLASPRADEELAQLRERDLDRRRRNDGAGIFQIIDRAIVVIRDHHRARVHAGNAAHGFVLALAKHVADELIRAAGNDIDVLADVILGVENHMHPTRDDRSNEQGE